MVSWLHVWSILCVDLREPIFVWKEDCVLVSIPCIRTDPLFKRYVRHALRPIRLF
jgi:hypothetical protein